MPYESWDTVSPLTFSPELEQCVRCGDCHIHWAQQRVDDIALEKRMGKNENKCRTYI